MRNQLRKRKQARAARNFRARNGLLTAERDWRQIAEDAVLNPRRHQELQDLSQDLSKEQLRQVMRQNSCMSDGINREQD